MKKHVLTISVLALLLSSCAPSTAPVTAESPPQETATEQPAPLPSETAPPKMQKKNLALRKPVTASNSRPENPPELAVDGINRDDNFWSADWLPPQWIEIDLGEPSDIYEIRLIVYQYPSGESLHRVLGRAAKTDDFVELHIFDEFAEDGQVLSVEPNEPWESLRYIRVETLESAPDAYVEWREIEVVGVPAGAEVSQPQADSVNIIFHNGHVITMEADQPSATAIAIRGETILAVGRDAEVLAYASAETTIIDLGGLTVMPGFVDPHTHLLKDQGLGIEGGQQLALENGITAMTEMTTPPWFLDELKAANEQGKLRVRVTAYLGYSDPCGEITENDWYLEHPPTREFGEMLHISGVKFFADGGVCGLPAVSCDPRAGRPRHRAGSKCD